jgi:hypothetical protein
MKRRRNGERKKTRSNIGKQKSIGEEGIGNKKMVRENRIK